MTHNHHAGIQTLESMNQALWYNHWTLTKFASVLHGDILEVGCGIGNFTRALTKFGSVWAFDSNPHCVAETKKKHGKNAHIGIGDIERGTYFFRKKKFDAIVCLNVLEHIEGDQAALMNMHNLLKPGGSLVLLVPIHPWLFGTIDTAIYHFRRYTVSTLIQQMKNLHFTVVFKRKLNFLGAIGWFISGRILQRTTISSRRIGAFNVVAPIILPLEDLAEPPIGTSVLVIAKPR